MKYIIITLIIWILFLSCHTSKRLTKENSTESIDRQPLYIFSIPEERVIQSIDEILRQDIDIYTLENKFISFDLVCDTTTGKVLSVEIEEDFGLSRSSKKLREYFISLSPVKCAVYPISGKVSEYYLIVSLVKESIDLHIGYGYKDE